MHTARQILEIIKSNKKGYYTGNRMIFPFKCNFLKVIADSHIMTEFKKNEHISVSQEAQNTSLYFTEVGRLKHFEDGYKSIKILLAPLDCDLTDVKNHIKLICHIEGNHQVELSVPNQDDLFII